MKIKNKQELLELCDEREEGVDCCCNRIGDLNCSVANPTIQLELTDDEKKKIEEFAREEDFHIELNENNLEEDAYTVSMLVGECGFDNEKEWKELCTLLCDIQSIHDERVEARSWIFSRSN